MNNQGESTQFEEDLPNVNAASVQELENRCFELEDKVKQLDDQLKRSIADYQNLLRRSQQEREQMRLYAAEPAIQTLIPALDNFYYALKSLNETSSSEQLLSSLRMIWGNLLSSLERIGFKLIEGVEQSFDPMSHEAVTQIPNAEQAEGTILEVFRPGYSLNGKVLKPAQVAVSISQAKN